LHRARKPILQAGTGIANEGNMINVGTAVSEKDAALKVLSNPKCSDLFNYSGYS